ncbi:MAG: polysaccharide deacetylase family protein [Chloroflexi bacterium]|nr:polysaccharide deacetylase family protein [Chloroflexota bacterium]
MSDSLSVVVVTNECGSRLLGTLDSLKRQATAPHEIIVVYPDGPDGPPPMIRAVAARPGLIVVAAPGVTPGAVRNAAIRQATGSLVSWLDEGDLLEPRFSFALVAALESGASAFAAPIASLSCMSGDPRITPPLLVPAVDLDALLRASDRVPISAVVRRAVWEDVDGFDETLAAWDEYDFWLRVMDRGHLGVAVDVPLVTRVAYREASWRRALAPEVSTPALRTVIQKHLSLFQRDPAGVLISRERRLRDRVSSHQDAVSRRDRLAAEAEEGRTEAERLEQFLREHGRDAIEWGDLRYPAPVSYDWGYDRGAPVDRYYIEQFLEHHAADIRGVVLEVQESNLTRRYGQERVERHDVVDVNPSNPGATVIADLRDATPIPSNTYDCFILTQTIHVIDDMPAVLRECYRILKPGGVLLVTLPCASRVCLEYGPDGDFWRVTEAGARRLFSDAFPPDCLEIHTYGNVLVNTAFFYGLAAGELADAEFEQYDPYNPSLVGVRAVKPPAAAHPGVANGGGAARAAGAPGQSRGVVLMYHRVAEPESDVHGLSVPPRIFQRQMEFLKRAWHVMPVGEFVEANAAGRLPDRAVAITFDDGYLDNLENAAPILVRLGLPAMFFLTTQAMRGRPEYWWDTLERVLIASPEVPPALEVTVKGEPVRLETSTRDQRMAAHARLHQAMVDGSLGERDDCHRRIVAWAGKSAPPPEARILSGGQMQELARLPGCAIGVHTVHHLGLPAQRMEVVGREIIESRQELERLLQRPVTVFAYPYGYYDDETTAAAGRAGLAAAFTCDSRAAIQADDRLCLPRVEVKAWSVSEMERQLTGVLQAAPEVRR